MAIELKSDLNVSGSLTVNGGPVGGGGVDTSVIFGTANYNVDYQNAPGITTTLHISGSGNHIVNLQDKELPIENGANNVDLVLYPDTWDNGAVFHVRYSLVWAINGAGQPFQARWKVVTADPNFEWYTSTWSPATGYYGYSRNGTGSSGEADYVVNYVSTTFMNTWVKGKNGGVYAAGIPYYISGYRFWRNVGSWGSW